MKYNKLIIFFIISSIIGIILFRFSSSFAYKAISYENDSTWSLKAIFDYTNLESEVKSDYTHRWAQHPFFTRSAIKLFEDYKGRDVFNEEEEKLIIRGSIEEDTDVPPSLSMEEDDIPLFCDKDHPLIETSVSPLSFYLPVMDFIDLFDHQRCVNHFDPAIIGGRRTTEFAQFFNDGSLTANHFAWENMSKVDKKLQLIMLGHVLHLLEDMGCPPHTRKDYHPIKSDYENFLEEFFLGIKYTTPHSARIRANAQIENLGNQPTFYFEHLRNLTQTGYFSKDTMFSDNYVKDFTPVPVDEARYEPYTYIYKDSINGTRLAYKGDDYIAVFSLRYTQYIKAGDDIATAKKKAYESAIKYSEIDELVAIDYFKELEIPIIKHCAGVINLFYETFIPETPTLNPLLVDEQNVNPDDSITFSWNSVPDISDEQITYCLVVKEQGAPDGQNAYDSCENSDNHILETTVELNPSDFNNGNGLDCNTTYDWMVWAIDPISGWCSDAPQEAWRSFTTSPNPLDVDNDGDGYTENNGDCDDSNPAIHPGAEEVCSDGIDNNCNDEVDEGCVADSYSISGRVVYEGTDTGIPNVQIELTSMDVFPALVRLRAIAIPFFTSTNTDQEGNYIITGIPEGDYFLTPTYPESPCFSFTPSSLDIAVTEDLTENNFEGACHGEWQDIVDDTRLTFNSAYSGGSSLGVDSVGNLHISWSDGRDGNSEIYYTKLDNNGNTLMNDTRLTSNSGDSGGSSLGVDSSGNIHIAWMDDRGGKYYRIYYTKLNNNGNTLVNDTNLTSAINNSLSPSLGVDGSGNIHIAWEDSRSKCRYEIYYTKLNNNGNTLVDDTRLTFDNSSLPTLALDSFGNIHIAWTDSRNGNNEIYYTKLDNDGNTLVNDTRLTSDSSRSFSPSVGVDSAGNIHIAWHDNRDGNDEIYYTKLDNNGNTLVDDTRLTSDVAYSLYPSLGVDNSGNIHIAWQDYRDGNTEIYYTKLDNNGNTLVDDTRLTSDSADSRFPTLGLDNFGNIHIAWEDYRDGNWEIYYTKGKTIPE